MYHFAIAGVAELVYALDSKSSLERDEGSSPSSGTTKPLRRFFVAGEKANCLAFVRDLKDGAGTS